MLKHDRKIVELKKTLKEKGVYDEFTQIMNSDYTTHKGKLRGMKNILFKVGYFEGNKVSDYRLHNTLSRLGYKESKAVIKNLRKHSNNWNWRQEKQPTKVEVKENTISTNQTFNKNTGLYVDTSLKIEVGDTFYISNTQGDDICYTIVEGEGNPRKGLINHKTLLANSVIGKCLNETTGYIYNNKIMTGVIAFIEKQEKQVEAKLDWDDIEIDIHKPLSKEDDELNLQSLERAAYQLPLIKLEV